MKRDYLGKAIKIELRNGVCDDNPDLKAAVTTLSLMFSDYEYIARELSCGIVHPIWVDTFEAGLCQDTVYGVFFLWVSQAATMLSLFLLSIVSSIMMLYFDEYWDISEVTEDKLPRHGAAYNPLVDNEAGKQALNIYSCF